MPKSACPRYSTDMLRACLVSYPPHSFFSRKKNESDARLLHRCVPRVPTGSEYGRLVCARAMRVKSSERHPADEPLTATLGLARYYPTVWLILFLLLSLGGLALAIVLGLHLFRGNIHAPSTHFLSTTSASHELGGVLANYP